MARKQSQPGEFNPGEIPMSPGPSAPVEPAMHQQPQPQVQDQPVYSEKEVAEHSEILRLTTRKEAVLKLLHEKALAANEIYLANTLVFIMADYGFMKLEQQKDPGEGE